MAEGLGGAVGVEEAQALAVGRPVGTGLPRGEWEADSEGCELRVAASVLEEQAEEPELGVALADREGGPPVPLADAETGALPVALPPVALAVGRVVCVPQAVGLAVKLAAAMVMLALLLGEV